MYLGLGKSIIQFVVPPPGHGPLDILSGRQSEHFKIKWGQAYGNVHGLSKRVLDPLTPPSSLDYSSSNLSIWHDPP